MAVATIGLKIGGEHTMHCAGCARTVTLALRNVPGVLKVDADHRAQLVNVILNLEAARPEVLKDALGQLGYEAGTIETE